MTCKKGQLTRTLETCLKYPERIFGKRQGCSYVIDIIIHMNADGNTGGDDECESSDTKDRSDCSSSEDTDL